MNYILISPYYPKNFQTFAHRLKSAGVQVFGIGEEPYDQLGSELQKSLSEYYRVNSLENVDEVKPNPALYIKTLEALGLDQDEVVAVEDSVNGSLAAIRAGINCLIIPNEVTKALKFHEESHIIESYADFDLGHYLKKETWKRS